MGNKTAIQKQRRGFPEESGCYQYSYDKLQRLIGVEKDGKHIRSYQYDTFSNRIEMEDNTKGIKNIYQYNALNQLIEQKIWETPDITTKINTFINGNDIDNINHNNNANILHKTFTYDKRGNLTGEYQEDALLHGYHFNRMNRLEKAWNYQGEEAQYFYNALGQRTGRTANGEREDYLLDLTKPYHNLLELQKGKQTQIFFWDFNAAVMEDEKRNLQYYLQDELGSPLRVLYRNGYGEAYGYDEFGTELYESDSIKEEKTRKKYGKQGENQPFGYTGYRYDNISGSYFAQAREYMPEVGRFISEDIILGRNTIPKTLNRYSYCWSNPIRYIDLNGKDPVTPQQARDTAWEFWEDQIQKAVNEIDSIQNNINETIDAGVQIAKDVMEAVENGIQTGLNVASDIIDSGIQTAINTAEVIGNGIQTGVNAAVDFGKNTWNTAIDLAILAGKTELALFNELTGIGTANISLSGRSSGGTGSSSSGGIGLTMDISGNYAIQINWNIGAGLPTLGAGYSIMFSNAPSYKNLEGWGAILGDSWGEVKSIGCDLLFMDGYIGYVINDGYAFNSPKFGFIELHGEIGYTETLRKINIFEILESLKSQKIQICS